MRYNKLVRDKIPAIISARGGTPRTHIASRAEFDVKLREKLREEVEEFLKDGDWEKLADILEVVYALNALAGKRRTDLTQARNEKERRRGAFKKRIILEEA